MQAAHWAASGASVFGGKAGWYAALAQRECEHPRRPGYGGGGGSLGLLSGVFGLFAQGKG